MHAFMHASQANWALQARKARTTLGRKWFYPCFLRVLRELPCDVRNAEVEGRRLIHGKRGQSRMFVSTSVAFKSCQGMR